MYLVNNYEDSFEEAIAPLPDSLTISEETWFSIHSLREQFTMKFLELYARHYSDKSVIDAYEAKCLVDKIITIFIGDDEKMRTSQSECIQFCESHFNYQIPALHGLLKPEHRSIQEQINEIERNSID